MKILIVFVLCLTGISSIYAHGVDVTADTMIISDESNGVIAKEIADDNKINISVYKFTSEDEVAHQLEHMLTNDNKRILVLTYQDIAKDFLSNHPDLSNRLIIVDDVNNDTIKAGILELVNSNTSTTTQSGSFIVPLVSGLAIGLILGLGCGVLIMKRKR